MSTVKNNWYVITGAPSSGKSTIITRLAKQGYKTTEEYGRLLIDQEMAAGKTLEEINVDSVAFEEAWVELQGQAEAALNPQQQIIFDRGVLDTLTYFKCYGWPVTPKIKQWCSQARYKKVFLFELLEYEKDYARIETEETAQKMQELFYEAYVEAGYEVIRVPKDTIDNRLKLVMSHLDQSQ